MRGAFFFGLLAMASAVHFSSTLETLWAVTQRQPNPDKPMFKGSVRMFSDRKNATAAAAEEDGDGDQDLPLHDMQLEASDDSSAGLPADIWICGVWSVWDRKVVGLLPRAFRSLHAARAAAVGFSPPSAIGLNAADCSVLKDDEMDPNRLILEIVHMSSAGQPDGEYIGAACEDPDEFWP